MPRTGPKRGSTAATSECCCLSLKLCDMLEYGNAPGADYAKIQEIPMANQQGTLAVTDFEVGWLAGIIDGEGTIAFSVYPLRHNGKILQDVRVKPQIIVTNTDKCLIEKVADIFGRR